MKAVTAANMTVVISLFDDAANTVLKAEASTKTVRQARRITPAVEASASDYAAGEF